MSEERIVIEIVDKVAPTIAPNLDKIAAASQRADMALQRLATEKQRTATAAQRLATEQARTATASQRLAMATSRASIAQSQSATASQRLATEQARTAGQTSRAAAAADRAAIASLRLSQAQARVAKTTHEAGASMGSFARGAASIAATVLSAGVILQNADAYTALGNKLRIVADSTEQLIELRERLFVVANETRSSVEATVVSYTRFDNALNGLGKSQEDSIRLTTTVNKLLKVGGATAQEAASAQIQLSQAFNSNTLAGEEFRAISENMPKQVRIALAEVLGIQESALKKAAANGLITGDVLFRAFQQLEGFADSKFKETITTLPEAMTVLKNKTIEAFGKINESLGITAGLSSAIVFLADNMKTLAVIAAATGAALLVAFGPVLAGALATASGAVLAFTLALAANPLGLLIVALAAGAVALAAFGDEIKVTADGAVSLKDAFLGALGYIKQSISAVASFFREAWGGAMGYVDDLIKNWGGSFGGIFSGLRLDFAAVGNLIIGTMVGAFDAVKIIWDKFPQIMKGFFVGAVNLAAEKAEDLVNVWQLALRSIAKLSERAFPDMAKSLNDALDSSRINLPRLEMPNDAAAALADIKKAVTDAYTPDYVAGIAESLKANAGPDAAKGELRGTGTAPEDATAIGKLAEAAEKRATALNKVNAQLDNEIARMGMLQPLREEQARFDQIAETLAGKKIQLSASEESAIKSKIKAIQEGQEAQREFDRIYDESTRAQRDYNATITAADALLKSGAITQAVYAVEIERAASALADAKDPMRGYNQDLKDQHELLKLLPPARQIEQQMMQLENAAIAAGIPDREKYLEQKRKELELLQQQAGVSAANDALYSQFEQPRQDFANKTTAVSELENSGDQSRATSDLVQGMGLNPEGLQVHADAHVAIQAEMYSRIDELRKQNLISEQDAAMLTAQVNAEATAMRLANSQKFFGDMSSLSKSGNSKIAAIGKASAIAQATIDGVLQVQKALASAPPPANFALAAAAGVAAAANVATISGVGFREGGYTGPGGVNDVAGVVHGKEFVMNAGATSRIGVANLQALQSGAAGVQKSSDRAGSANSPNFGPAPAPVINNSMSAVVVQSRDAALAAIKSAEGQAFIIETIEQNGGTVARIIGGN
jgi:tape measure domain-containing protein